MTTSGLFCHPKLKVCSLDWTGTTHPLPTAPGSRIPPSVSVNVSAPGNHTSGGRPDLSLRDCLTAPHAVFEPTHLEAGGSTSFLCQAEEDSTVCTHHTWCNHASTEGHLGCLYLWAVVRNATMNLGEQSSLKGSAFNSQERIFHSRRNHQTFVGEAAPNSHLHQGIRSNLSTASSAFTFSGHYCCSCFYSGHPNGNPLFFKL